MNHQNLEFPLNRILQREVGKFTKIKKEQYDDEWEASLEINRKDQDKEQERIV